LDTLTASIAEYAASIMFEDIPTEVVHSANQRIVDTLACALGAYDCEQVQIGRRLAPPVVLPHKNAGRILGFRDWTTAEEAAFVNTAMIRNWDWNDVFPGSHPSDCLGAFFALAEPAGADGRTFLTSTVIAYEVITRLAASTQLRRRGWDQGFGIGISTVAGLGHMFRLPFEAIANAVAIITVANVPLRATRAGKLSLWKGSATSFATRNAAFATLLAAEGMTGPDRPFDGRHGLWEQITGPFEMEPFGGRGGRFTTPTAEILAGGE
jgi:2-methylcitrate dehydratase